jgi:serine/threonine-protein kinase
LGDVLFKELVALDLACHQRYGRGAQPENPWDLGAPSGATASSVTGVVRSNTKFSADQRPDWPTMPGLELIEVVGSGGMGVVFKARQTTLERVVAVKVLRNDYRDDREHHEHRERFLQEARAVARLRHPHLVQLYEFGEVPDAFGVASRPYLVLEYVAGGSLSDRLLAAPLLPREAAQLVETLAEAIHYAHEQGVIHRDLKPANVLLPTTEVDGEGQTEVVGGPRSSRTRARTPEVRAKLTDFGLAKFLADSDLTRTGAVLGTPSYMAPEQTMGRTGLITPAVDVYGLGAILYETLTGRPPFKGADGLATLEQVRQSDPVPPSQLQPKCPRDLETICLKCLRKEAGRRYASAQDLADDLRRFRAGEPVRARPVSRGERMVRWCRRNPRIAGLLAALVLVFLTGSAGVLWQWERATRNAAEAQRNAVAFQQERDMARQEQDRAEHHLQMVRDGVDRLSQLGQDLLKQPGKYRTGQAVLVEALDFYKQMLPQDLSDPLVRKKAAELYRQVAEIEGTLGQVGKAAADRRRHVSLLSSLLKDDPANREMRMKLADGHRQLGNTLRDLGKPLEAAEAYDQAAKLHEGLLNDFPGEARYRMALANTLLNKASLLSRQDHAEELEPVYRRIVDMNRDAVKAAPAHPNLQAELALALLDQGLFFLDTGRRSEAEAAVVEALVIHKQLLDGGRLKGYIERYAARNYVYLGLVLVASGKTPEAEQSYREAVSMLDRSVRDFPESVYHQVELAQALTGQADLLKDPGRRQEAQEIRRRVKHIYETLRANSPDNPSVNNELAWILATSPEPGLRDSALAVRFAKQAVATQQESPDFRNTLGVALFRNGDDKAAIAELETSMSLRTGGDGRDWCFLAMAHWRLGDRDKARSWFQRAVEWIDKYKSHDEELRRFRAEAEEMLGAPPK